CGKIAGKRRSAAVVPGTGHDEDSKLRISEGVSLEGIVPEGRLSACPGVRRDFRKTPGPRYATAAPLVDPDSLFLLPGGRPRRLAVSSEIQAGGRPRRRPRPRASRSRLMIASSICSLSSRNSERILLTSIALPSNKHPSTLQLCSWTF